MNWMWRTLVLVVIVGGIKYSWGQQDDKIDTLGLADTTIMEKVGENTAAIGKIETAVGKIETAQKAVKEDVKEIKDKLEIDRKERREDMRELKELIRAKNGNP